MLALPDAIERLVQVLHNVEAVKDNLLFSLRHMHACGMFIRPPHVHCHRLNPLPLLVGELLVIPRQTLAGAMLGHILHRSFLQVADHRE